MSIAIAVEGLTALSADEMIDGFAVDSLRVAIPPSHAAFVRTEFLFFPVGRLYQHIPTLETSFFRSLRIPSAHRFDSIDGIAGDGCDFFISKPLSPVFQNLD